MSDSSPAPTTRGRGRGKSRGGLGKYLRARGRGHGRGRPAEFGNRILLEGEGPPDEDDEEAAERAAELAQKFSRRQLGTNADRYAEPEPVLDSDGEPEVEPEVDLSSFLERQRISDAPGPSVLQPTTDSIADDDDVDYSLAHISSTGVKPVVSRKGKVEQIEWDDELDELEREKLSAEAIWDLKTRFRAKSEKLRKSASRSASWDLTPAHRTQGSTTYVDAPPLPLADGSLPPPKGPKADMEDFLDDLLT
ncbi:hypothetical protein B0H14DRAFT_2366242 [Mycena olivaceomarginata]|nr:hypothetical protein B0H14DRAFT_2366242 [Mycena olivaceomarginata]